MQPNNGLIDEAGAVELPIKPVDEEAINDLKRKAKYSRSKEYAELRTKAQERIDFYQRFLPNGQPVGSADRQNMEHKWELANILIAEFEQLFGEHEYAAELLKEMFGE